ncbi:hypothetical protein BD414DRAFT_557756 [Trametes punicea]|nr:hypothetical protein BD414DRAFT_557756 [Trametes punicea]
MPRVYKSKGKKVCGQHSLFPVRQLKCTWPGCEHRFHQESNMKTHLNMHTGSRPCLCPEKWVDEHGMVLACAARYRDPSAVTRHRKEEHGYVPKSGKGPRTPRFRSAAQQARDAEEYGLAERLGISLNEARKMLRKEKDVVKTELPSTPPPALSSASSSSSPSLFTSSAFASSSFTTSSSASSSSITPPSVENSSFPDYSSFDLSAATMNSDLALYGNFSAPAWDTTVLPQEAYCNLAFSLPPPPTADFPGREEQPQLQNFVDVVNQANLLLPSQIPTQFFDAFMSFSAPFAFPESFYAMGTGFDMCTAAQNLCYVDVPSGPVADPLASQSSIWDAFFFASTPSSSASSPPKDEDALDFPHQNSA